MMKTYVLLLRGVNVGKKNSLPMQELRSMLTQTGCEDVQTYLQSGNAIFKTSLNLAKVSQEIEGRLARYMGRPIPTTLRNLEDLKKISDANPFKAEASTSNRLCVTFLSQPPDESSLTALLATDWSPERCHWADREIYSWHPDGQARSALGTALGKLPLAGTITTRNWNTVTKLLGMLNQMS